jgi:predicted TIM-barrel fold metal-dependent hydrolase
MIIDSHTHYMEPPSAERPHVNHSIMEPITVDEIAAHAAAVGVDRVVQVTGSMMGEDNRFSIEGAAARPDKVFGVVGRFDPIAPGVKARLAAYFAQPHILSLRLTLFLADSEAWLRERALEPFLRAAADLRVPVCVHAPFQNAELQETVRRHRGVRFVVDHMNIRHEQDATAQSAFRQWPQLLALAAEPNVWIKVTYFPEAAMGSERYPFPTARQRFRELYDHVGAARLVWGSNYPVVKRACSYQEAVDFVRVGCDFLSAAERAAIMGANAAAVFAGGAVTSAVTS